MARHIINISLRENEYQALLWHSERRGVSMAALLRTERLYELVEAYERATGK